MSYYYKLYIQNSMKSEVFTMFVFENLDIGVSNG